MEENRIYFARRAAEEERRALSAADPLAAQAHRQLHQAYRDRATVGDRIRQPEAAR